MQRQAWRLLADRAKAPVSRQLRVNPIACDGSGLCAELLPERIRLDDWGYPIIEPGMLPPELEEHAERAVAACPTMALLVTNAATSRR